MSRKLLALSVTAVAVLAFVAAGCGSDDPDSAADTGATAPFDRAFIDGMVPHHEEAIQMATDAKAAGLQQPVLVDIADAIIGAQQSEIDRMTKWRGEWFDSAEIDPNGADGLGLSMEQMGMQSERMDFSAENDVDAAFATMMAAHHEGAIEMARLAREKGEHPEIRALADAIIAAQQDELDLMRKFTGGGEHDMGGMGSG